jgi:hypothetical protein
VTLSGIVMTRDRRELREFVIPLLVLLPAAYFVWYVLGAWFLFPVAMLSDLLSQWLFPNTVQRVVQDGVFLLVVVTNTAGGIPSSVPPNGSALTAVDAFRVYGPPLGAGIPLFLALAVASDAQVSRHLRNLVVGVVVLLLGQTVSVLLKVTATLFSQVPAFRPASDLCSADCYWTLLYPVQYFSYLILPTLLAIVLWATLYAPTLRLLLPTLRDHLAGHRKAL